MKAIYTTELNGELLIGTYSKLVMLINKSGLIGNRIILINKII